MGKKTLEPGFRFHPTDVELVIYYLKRKVMGKKLAFNDIAEVDIYKHAPWDLPNMSSLSTADLKWFFYCPMEKKYGKGARLNRATLYGYWKTTGRDRDVKYDDDVVGMRKTLVFHEGKAPKGVRTDWVMHEYRLEERKLTERGIAQDSYTLCVVFKKDGLGPRNGCEYGAPFKEDDWSDGEEEEPKLPGTCGMPTVESSELYTLNHSNNDGMNVTNDIASGLLEVTEVADYEEWNDNTLPMLLEYDTDVTPEGGQMEATHYLLGNPIVYEEYDTFYMLQSFDELDNFSESL